MSSSESNVWSNETADEQSLEKTSTQEILLNFFFPTTCIPQENQVVKPCNEQKNYKKTECLANKCCFSSSKISNVNCLAPLQDKPTQTCRMSVLGVIATIILGCLPICCSSFWWRSKRANPLPKRVNKIVKNMKKHRKKEKKDAETIEKTAEDEKK
ncbi:fragile X mental retardation 1 neighbor protein [Suricata suricatta]|uniref:fragile X mental retardation 1 neighbor protein n=1 Tax=Suricata suricatta TaxID=37032 RepID=UPI001155A652|nr:fragile X mental retardation 1 neighbor protein [Suricata suricatta]